MPLISSAAARSPRRRRDAANPLVLTMLCTAQALDILNLSSVNIALPSIAADLGESGPTLSWVVSAYALTFAGFLMVSGRIADLYGHRRVMVAGMVVFGASSLAVSFADSLALVVVARAVQGIGAAATVSAALGLVGVLWPQEPQRSRALGAFGAMGGVGLAVGLVLGGALTGTVGWRSMFVVNVVVVAILVVGVLIALPADHSRPTRRGKVDIPGALLITCGLLCLSFGLTQLGETALSPLSWASVAAGVTLLLLFAIWQRRTRTPLLPPLVWRQRNIAAIVSVAVCLYAGWVGVNYYAALLLQNVLGYTPLGAGVAFLPLAIGGTILPLLAGSLVPRFGAKPILLLGLAVYAIGLALLTLVGPGADYWLVVLPILILISVGMSHAFVSANVLALADAPTDSQALVGAVWNTALQVGGGLGLAVLSATAAVAGDPLGSYRVAFATASAIAVAGFIIAAVRVRRMRSCET